jgi:hypothetical protein
MVLSRAKKTGRQSHAFRLIVFLNANFCFLNLMWRFKACRLISSLIFLQFFPVRISLPFLM